MLLGHWLQTTTILQKWAVSAVTCALFARLGPTHRRAFVRIAQARGELVVMPSERPGFRFDAEKRPFLERARGKRRGERQAVARLPPADSRPSVDGRTSDPAAGGGHILMLCPPAAGNSSVLEMFFPYQTLGPVVEARPSLGQMGHPGLFSASPYFGCRGFGSGQTPCLFCAGGCWSASGFPTLDGCRCL
jgi:hypothetical protein